MDLSGCASAMTCRALIFVVTSVLYDAVMSKTFVTQMSSRIVETQYGRIRGVLVTLPDPRLPRVEAYYGLQYASLLGGDLRFMPPTGPMEKWDGIRVALKYRPVCPQKLPDIRELQKKAPYAEVERWKNLIPFLEKQQEECLNLNIYVPFKEINDSNLFPVLLFVHAETYETGTGNAYDGSVLSALGQIIVITINYRLGAHGFFSTDDNNAPGNYALLDLVAALHYIRENIPAFGGDPNEVTLMGHGYASALVNLLLISPVTKGKNLFKRAIILGGSALSSWAIVGDPLRYAIKLSSAVNCSQHSSDHSRLVHCMKTVPWDALANARVSAPKFFSAFGPVVDQRSVLSTDVTYLLQKSPASFSTVFDAIPILLGLSKNEGCCSFLTRAETEDAMSELQRQKFLRTYVQNVFRFHRQKIYDILAYHYRDWERPRDPGLNIIDLISDGLFVAPAIEMIRLHASLNGHRASTWMYSVGHSASRGRDVPPRWMAGGWAHSTDLAYGFGAPLVDGLNPFQSSYNRPEMTLAETMLKYWINFIKTGNPNDSDKRAKAVEDIISSNKVHVYWPPYDTEKQQYLQLDIKSEVGHHFRGAKMALWLDLIPRIHRSDNLTDQFHLLDNYDNLSSFEPEGLDFETLQQMIRLYPPAPPPSTTTAPRGPNEDASTAWTSSTSIYAAAAMDTPSDESSKRHLANLPRVTARSTSRPAKQHAVAESSSISNSEMATLTLTANLQNQIPLSITIGVGCALLFLNILVFAAIFYQRGKAKQNMENRRRELQNSKKRNFISRSAHDDDDNCSDNISKYKSEHDACHDRGHESDSNSSVSSAFSSKLSSSECKPHHPHHHRHHPLHQNHYNTYQYQTPRGEFQRGDFQRGGGATGSFAKTDSPVKALTWKDPPYATVPAKPRPIVKKPLVDENCYEEALLNEFSRLESEAVHEKDDDNPSTLV